MRKTNRLIDPIFDSLKKDFPKAKKNDFPNNKKISVDLIKPK